jgi:hypothetical protein
MVKMKLTVVSNSSTLHAAYNNASYVLRLTSYAVCVRACVCAFVRLVVRVCVLDCALHCDAGYWNEPLDADYRKVEGCLLRSQVCNGMMDCVDGQDEQNCRK